MPGVGLLGLLALDKYNLVQNSSHHAGKSSHRVGKSSHHAEKVRTSNNTQESSLRMPFL